MVRLAAKRLQTLCPQVINAARTLAARPHSKVARENMDVFKEAWEKQLQVLTEAVDDITSIDEFLATTGGVQKSGESVFHCSCWLRRPNYPFEFCLFSEF